MGIQFLLFAMANLGVEMLLERQRGLWRRLRSAPVSRFTLLAARVVSGAVISLLILCVCFAFAMAVFGVRIDGSFWGFAGVALACALMASTFGILVAALGNTPATARGCTPSSFSWRSPSALPPLRRCDSAGRSSNDELSM
jgi:ABC-2 type transport system permease protein